MNISLKSLDGLNGISSVILVNTSTFNSGFSKINNTIKSHNIQIKNIKNLTSLSYGVMINYSVSYGLVGYKIKYSNIYSFQYIIFREPYLSGFGINQDKFNYYSLLSGAQSLMILSYQDNGIISLSYGRINYFYIAVAVEVSTIIFMPIIFVYNKRRGGFR